LGVGGLSKEELIRKIQDIENGLITVKIEDGEIVSTSIQRQDLEYREG